MNRDSSARLLHWSCVLLAWLASGPLFAQSLLPNWPSEPFLLAPGKPSPVATPPYVYEYQPTLVPEHDAWVWADADYILQWMKNPSLPPLVTTGPATTLGPNGAPGVLGQPGTTTLLGGEKQHMGVFQGGRFLFGGWIMDEQWLGMEGGALFLLQQKVSSTIASTGNVPLSIPFFDALTGTPDSVAIASPLAVPPYGASATVTTQTQLVGAEATFVFSLCNQKGYRLELLSGFRWLKLDDTVEFDTNSNFFPPAPGGFFGTIDRFQVHNNFYGANIGLRSDWCWNRCLLNITGKIAFGDTQQTVRPYGATVTNYLTGLSTVAIYPGGYLVQISNGLPQRRDAFAVLPDITIKGGYLLTKCCRVYLGYNFLYLSSVARAGDQIDQVINPGLGVAFSTLAAVRPVNNFIAFPTYRGNSTDFWVQGISAGFEVRF